jgi:hypothetical protein
LEFFEMAIDFPKAMLSKLGEPALPIQKRMVV